MEEFEQVKMSLQTLQHCYNGYLLFNGILPEEVELKIIKTMRMMLKRKTLFNRTNPIPQINEWFFLSVLRKEPFMIIAFDDIDEQRDRCNCCSNAWNKTRDTWYRDDNGIECETTDDDTDDDNHQTRLERKYEQDREDATERYLTGEF